MPDLYERLRRMDPVCNAGPHIQTRAKIGDVDWDAVHSLQAMAPLRIEIPELDAKARQFYATDLQDYVRSTPPEIQIPAELESDHDPCSYLLIHRHGEHGFGSEQLPVRSRFKYVWFGSNMDALSMLNADVVAIYKAINIQHRWCLRVFGRHHLIYSAEPREDALAYVEDNTVSARLVPREEVEAAGMREPTP